MTSAIHLSDENLAAIAHLVLQSGLNDHAQEQNRLAIGHLRTCEACRRQLDTFVGDDIALEIALSLAEVSHVASVEDDRSAQLTARMMMRLRSDVAARSADTSTSPQRIVGAHAEPELALPGVKDNLIPVVSENQTRAPMPSDATLSAPRHRGPAATERSPRNPRFRAIYRVSIGVVPLLLAASIAIVMVRERRTLNEITSSGTSDSSRKVASTDSPSVGPPEARRSGDPTTTSKVPTAPQPLGAPARGPGRPRGTGALPDSSATGDPASDSIRASHADSLGRIAASEPGPHFTVHETAEGLTVGLSAVARSLELPQEQAVDSAVSALKRDPQRRAVIRYEDPSNSRESASWKLAERAKEYMEMGGIATGRIRLVRVQTVSKTGLPSRLDAVAIIVQGPQDQ